MLKLYFPESEAYIESKNEFVYYPERTIYLEHSLVSISKWEAKWHKPFLKTTIRMMKRYWTTSNV